MSTKPDDTESGDAPPALPRAGEAGGDGSELSRDELFEVLGNKRRQYVLQSLDSHENDEIDFSELVTRVAAKENEVSLKEVDSDERKSVYVGLRQTHLPKMSECDLIEYDRDRGTVELDDAAEQARMYLEFVPEDDIPWAHHYLGVSAVLAAITGLTWQGIYPFANLQGIVIAVIAVAVLGVSAVAHSIHTRRNRVGSDGFDLFSTG